MKPITTKIPSPQIEQPGLAHLSLDYRNEWSSSLCDCCSDMKLCCCAFFCPICFECIVFTDARECILTGVIPNSLGNLRAKIRSSYNIKGNIDVDVCAARWLYLCTLIQLKKELNFQGESSGYML